MIDLERLVIKKGDIVKRISSPEGLESVAFIVDRTTIDNLVQMVHPEVGPPIPASELMIINKNEELTVAEKNKAALEEMLNSIFGDRWDITDGGGGLADKTLLIHFPEVEIKNSKGNSHLIRDLYIANRLNNNYSISSGTIYGMRTTLTQAEENSSYVHSHLSSSGFSNFSAFCTGSGIIDENLTLIMNTNPSERKFAYEIYFESLVAFVAWESIEGGPYRRIGQIRSRGSYAPTPHRFNVRRSSSTIRDLMPVLKNNNFKIPINYNLTGKVIRNSEGFINIDRNTFKQELRNFLFNNLDLLFNFNNEQLKRIFVVEQDLRQEQYSGVMSLDYLKNLNNERVEDSTTYTETLYRSSLIFRGECIIFKRITSKSNSILKDSITINNSLVDVLIYKFTKKFYEKLFGDEDEFIKELTNGNS